jgi:hypothetical protein
MLLRARARRLIRVMRFVIIFRVADCSHSFFGEEKCDSPRLVRRNCEGAFGANSMGASSMKLVVQILSFPEKLPTE